MNFIQRYLTNKKISRSLKSYHVAHRNMRAVPLKKLGKVVAYAYVPKAYGFRPAIHI